jgi:hypothetical protein
MPQQDADFAKRNPPRCIRALHPDPTSSALGDFARDPEWTWFSLACPCGCKGVFILGYHAMSQVSAGTPIFVAPLAIECPECHLVSEVMDPRKDGYGGEISSSAGMTGTGPRSRFSCWKCGRPTRMVPLVGFSYQLDDLDGDMLARRQDYFDVFDLFARCAECGQLSEITEYECA